MQSNTRSSSSVRRLLAATAIVGLVASSVVSAVPVGTSTNGSAPFGDITSGSDKCVVGNPNEYITSADLEWIWDKRIGRTGIEQTSTDWSVPDNKNWIMDHIVKNQGTINYCIRWDSTNKLTKSVASKFQAMLTRQFNAWNRWLVGYNCWPYEEIKVNVVGWAVRDAKLLEWSDDSLGKIYEGNLDTDTAFEGTPMCPQNCNRFYDVGINGWSDTSACATEPFDLFLLPTQGLEGGFGFDWGQKVNLENMLSMMDEEELTIIAHEIGHGFGLPDFYEKADMPSADFPATIMEAGRSMAITEGDGWMLRRVFEHLKSRYNF